jgi:hypothetical protein
MADERSAPATKGELLDVQESLTEAIYDSKTEILKAIYGFTETVQNRFQEMDQTEASLKLPHDDSRDSDS